MKQHIQCFKTLLLSIVILFFWCANSLAQETVPKETATFKNGNFDEFLEWHDTHGDIINAHDGGIIFVNNKYYWYGLALRPLGEDKGENSGAATTTGINLYSSTNLLAWHYEGVILPTSQDITSPLRSPMRLERPKIIYNKKTNKFVMWFHYVGYPGNHKQDIGFADAGVAVADKITGPFQYIGHQRPINDSGAVKDCTLFMDNDTTAYFVYDRKMPDGSRCLHVVQLTDDFLNTTNKWAKIDVASRREAPAVFKHDGTYFLITSDVSGWKANAAKTFKSNNMLGPWIEVGNPCAGEQKESTYNTQCTSIFEVHGTKNLSIIMLERHNTSNFLKCAYVWLPIEMNKNEAPFFPYKKEWGFTSTILSNE
jgi:beta-galactosidase